MYLPINKSNVKVQLTNYITFKKWGSPEIVLHESHPRLYNTMLWTKAIDSKSWCSHAKSIWSFSLEPTIDLRWKSLIVMQNKNKIVSTRRLHKDVYKQGWVGAVKHQQLVYGVCKFLNKKYLITLVIRRARLLDSVRLIK